MTSINVTVSGELAEAVRTGKLTTGMVGIPVSFSFDAAWEGLKKIAVFRCGSVIRDRSLILSESTTVPHEVLMKAEEKLFVGAEGRAEDGTLVIPTVWAEVGVVLSGANATGREGKVPTPNAYDDIMAAIKSGAVRGPEGPVGPQGPKGDPYPRSINLGKLTNGEKAAISNTTPAECTQAVNPDADLHYIARWVYAKSNVDISDYVDSVDDNFAAMFDTSEDAPLGEKYKLLDRPSVMLLPGSYGGNEYMQSHGYRYTMQAQDYKTGDIFCASVKVYTKQGDLRDAYFMAISLGGTTFLACYNYGAGTPFTVTYADIEAVEEIVNGNWIYGIGSGEEECFPEYYYVLRPENVAAADAISLGKEFQGFKRETKAGLAECANALKGSASGEVVALTDVSPVEHEMSVKVDVPGATVQKLGKNYALTSSANKPINMGAGSLLVSAKQLESTLKAGQTYTLTADISCENPDKVYLVQDSLFTTLGYFRNDGRQSLTFTVGTNDYAGLYLYGGKDLATSKLYAATFENITVCEGTPQNYTADENGIVRGIIGNGESMTLLTDTEGVTIEAEYNKDTNKVIESLVQAIISLGGNV